MVEQEKKKSTKKTSNKKKSVNSKKKDENIEKTTSNKNNKKKKVSTNVNKNNKEVVVEKVNKKDKGTIIMTITFFALLILVSVLFAVVIHKKHVADNELVAKMVFPVIEKDSAMSFSIDLGYVSEDDDYIFKITNYRDDKVNDFDVNYKIIIKNETAAKIKVFRGKTNVNLMKKQKNTEITDLKLYKNEKEDVYFRVSFSNLDKIKKKDMVDVYIVAE